MEDVARGVQELGLAQEAEARHRGADGRIFEGAGERVERAGSRERVRVEEDEHLAGRMVGSEVAGGGEADVLARLDELRGEEARGLLCLGLEGAGDDHDDLRHRARARAQRGQATDELHPRLVGDDDDGGSPGGFGEGAVPRGRFGVRWRPRDPYRHALTFLTKCARSSDCTSPRTE